MPGWTHVAVAAVTIGILLILLVVFIRRCCYHKSDKETVEENRVVRRTTENFQEGIARLHQQGSLSLNHHRHNHRQQQQVDLDSKRRGNFYVFRRGVSTKPLFNWADHPSLITDAVENGWSRFGFTNYISSPSTRSSFLGLCAASADFGKGNDIEISWEVCQGSADFMQKIRLNSGSFNKGTLNNHSNSMAAASVIRTALPLPGPALGNSAFPQEAYFEITILYCHGHGDDHDSSGKLKEGEKIKLIQENSNSNSTKSNSESLVHVTFSNHHDINKIEELKLATIDGGKHEAVMLSVGLTTGGSLPLKLPGTYPGSIGFNSDGSVYLDGIKLVFESEKEDWGKTEKVIGCGFNPRQMKVFFTLDSQLVHVINCKAEEFGTPLYPTLAANDDVLVLVNFGQSAFAYGPANEQRTPNPCFIGPLVNSPAAAALGYEDSKELFSMGRIDSQWLNRSTTKGSYNNNGSNYPNTEFDDDSEADLFEIVLDNSGTSPNSVL